MKSFLSRFGFRGVEQSGVDTPPSGQRTLFAKSDGWYDLDDTGTEVILSTGGSGVTSVNGDPGPSVTLDAAVVGAASRTGGGREATATLSATTGTCTGDLATASYFTITPTGNFTLAFSNVPSTGIACTLTVEINQGATPRTVTLPTGGVWLGAAPIQVANKVCLITIATRDGGTTLYASGIVQA